MVLGITQQVALIPVFLHYWTGDTLAAWLAIYAIGNLAFIANARHAAPLSVQHRWNC